MGEQPVTSSASSSTCSNAPFWQGARQPPPGIRRAPRPGSPPCRGTDTVLDIVMWCPRLHRPRVSGEEMSRSRPRTGCGSWNDEDAAIGGGAEPSGRQSPGRASATPATGNRALPGASSTDGRGRGERAEPPAPWLRLDEADQHTRVRRLERLSSDVPSACQRRRVVQHDQARCSRASGSARRRADRAGRRRSMQPGCTMAAPASHSRDKTIFLVALTPGMPVENLDRRGGLRGPDLHFQVCFFLVTVRPFVCVEPAAWRGPVGCRSMLIWRRGVPGDVDLSAVGVGGSGASITSSRSPGALWSALWLRPAGHAGPSPQFVQAVRRGRAPG